MPKTKNSRKPKTKNSRKKNSSKTKTQVYDAVIVGAGPAGIGAAIALLHAGIENFIILERFIVGASFALWPSETRFITPSFPTNSIGMLDLNAIALGTSPGFSLRTEHPTGSAYAAYLDAVARHYELPVRTKTEVLRISKVGDDFRVDLSEETLRAKHVVWAAGEFQYPQVFNLPGGLLCRHTATIGSYEELEGDDFVVVGGYESGIDAAYHLARRNKQVRVFDSRCPWESQSSDPSIALSIYSTERMQDPAFQRNVTLQPDTEIAAVEEVEGGFEIKTFEGEVFRTTTQPLLAVGFSGSHKKVADLFETREDGFPALNEQDESTIVPGMFLCGPAVRHDDHVFCFIYKYRQRFAVVAKAIADSLDLPAEGLEEYRNWGMYLDDLSCCGQACVC